MNLNQKWYKRNNKQFERIETIKFIFRFIGLITLVCLQPLMSLVLLNMNFNKSYEHRKFLREYIKPLEIFN